MKKSGNCDESGPKALRPVALRERNGEGYEGYEEIADDEEEKENDRAQTALDVIAEDKENKSLQRKCPKGFG